MNLLIFLPIFFFVSKLAVVETSHCAERFYTGAFKNQVCVCNATFCDEIEPVGEIKPGKVVVYRSSMENGNRLKKFIVKIGKRNDEKVNVTILIDATKKYQSIIGFGGAFTDSAGDNLVALGPTVQEKILQAYFGSDGLEYNIGRVPMASCDFSTHEYSYDDVPDDFDLSNFEIAKEDLKLKIPFLLRAINITNGNLQLFASPWSAPGWMKTTGRMKGGGPMRNDSRVYSTYAQYFVRFFEEYLSVGIKFWGVTIQNEPSTGAIMNWRWQTMNYTAETMRDFLRDYLGPELKGNNVTKDLKVMILDDNRDLLPGWADTIFNDSVANKYADGVAVHWYHNLHSSPTLLDITNQRHPDKLIFATEACAGDTGHHGPIMGDWSRAESYADDIITDLNHWVTGWTDWNLVLDETGGPNWVFNVVDAPIIVNRTSQEFYKQPMYYAMGHFSKFLPRGSTRIDTVVKGRFAISATAVTISGSRRTAVILNKGSSPVKAEIVDVTTNQSIFLDIPSRSIHTVIWEKTKN